MRSFTFTSSFRARRHAERGIPYIKPLSYPFVHRAFKMQSGCKTRTYSRFAIIKEYEEVGQLRVERFGDRESVGSYRPEVHIPAVLGGNGNFGGKRRSVRIAAVGVATRIGIG